ncbi:MAG: sulfotransferase domain-containing protein [Anaerolineales bacterium]|nr:sulfotransferase domain-containing protein [Anaerolineales bacterium]MBX3036986.1 sulfotransferase domain-containing protein [Anaerolineales bacterium]
MNNPILVTGSHRSGTTWVGKMLSANEDVAYISEPLNLLHRTGVFRVPVKYWYTYINKENEIEYLPAFQELLNFQYHLWLEIKSLRSIKDFLRMGRDFRIFSKANLEGQRALIKDPFALFSSAWFAEKLNCQVVITLRHPAGFTSSLKRLGWNFDFDNLLNQPLLMRDHLEKDRHAMQSVDKNDIVTQGALLWKFIYRFVHLTSSLFPRFNLVRHEDLSLDPVTGFQNLYQKLGLDFTEKVKTKIINSSSSENPNKLSKNKTHSVNLDSRANLDNWKKILTPEEITRIRNITEDVSHHFYSEQDW